MSDGGLNMYRTWGVCYCESDGFALSFRLDDIGHILYRLLAPFNTALANCCVCFWSLLLFFFLHWTAKIKLTTQSVCSSTRAHRFLFVSSVYNSGNSARVNAAFKLGFAMQLFWQIASKLVAVIVYHLHDNLDGIDKNAIFPILVVVRSTHFFFGFRFDVCDRWCFLIWMTPKLISKNTIDIAMKCEKEYQQSNKQTNKPEMDTSDQMIIVEY